MAGSMGVVRPRRVWLYLVVLVVLVGGTLVLCGTGLDLWISSLFYRTGGGGGWPLKKAAIIPVINNYGSWPTYVLAALGGLLLVLGLGLARFRAWWRRGAVILLTIVLGSWLIPNYVVKPHWGRPRPRDIAVFGGGHKYRPVWRPGPPSQGESFPSGFASMAFGLIGLVFLFPRRRGWGRVAGAGAIAWGGLMGLARIVQGAHFASDILWSGGLAIATALVLHDLVFRLTVSRLEADPARSGRPA
jgi:lipid A 4'-phosphatase